MRNILSKNTLPLVLIVIIIIGIFFILNAFSNSENSITNNLFADGYIKAGTQGKFGLINRSGETVMPFKFDEVVYDDKSQLAAVMLDGKWGFSDLNGNIKVKAEYDEVGIFGESELAPVKKENKWGYVNKNGELVVKPMYYTASKFSSSGIAVVEGDDGPLYINENGNKTLNLTYDMLGEFNERGYASVCVSEKFGIINKKGKVIIEPKYEREFNFDSENYAVVRLNDKYGVINTKDEIVVPMEYDHIMPTVAMFDSESMSSGFSKAYFIIFVNELLKEHNLFDDNGVAIAVKDNKAGLINLKGEQLILPMFNQMQVYHESDVVLVSDGEKYMYYDVKGNPLIKGEKFDKTNGFNHGLGVVLKNSKWGYVDEKGVYAIEPQYGAAFGFSKNNLAAVRQDEKWGYINKKGEFVINPTYAYASTFVDSIAKVYDGKVWKLINAVGEVVCDNIQTEPGLYSDGYAVVESPDGKFALYDLNGKLIAKTKCDVIGSNHKSSKLCQLDGCYNEAVEGAKYCNEHGVQ